MWDLSDPQKPVSHELLEGSLDRGSVQSQFDGADHRSNDPETQDSVLTLWDLSNPESPSKFGLVKEGTGDIIFSPDDRMLAIPSNAMEKSVYGISASLEN